MENVKKKMAELCKAVAAKGGNVIIIGDVKDTEFREVKDTEFREVICKMRGKVPALAMDMACVARHKDSEPLRGILQGANLMLEISRKVTEGAADAEVSDETTEEE